MAGHKKKGETKPRSKSLDEVLSKLKYPDLLTLLKTLFPTATGRREVAATISQMMVSGGFLVRNGATVTAAYKPSGEPYYSQSTIWNWVTNAHNWGEFTPEDWDFHGKQKHDPNRSSLHRRTIQNQEKCNIHFSCKACQHEYDEERAATNLNQMNLKLMKCPNCNKFGMLNIEAKYGEIQIHKTVVHRNGFTVEVFTDEEGNEIPSPIITEEPIVKKREKKTRSRKSMLV